MSERARVRFAGRPRVLVLGKDSRSFLACLRSLGRAGAEVHVAWHDPRSLALHSRYVTRAHELPRCEAASGPWVAALRELLARERFDLVLPTNDPTIFALRAQRAELEDLAHLHLPGEATFAGAFDKLRTWQLARELGIPVPRQVHVTGVAHAGDLLAELGRPVVLKPRTSFAFGRNKWEQTVRKADDAREVEAYLAALLEKGEVLAQENVRGEGVGVEVLAREGELLLAFQHRRLHEPPHGGSSSYRRSEALDARFLETARQLAHALELHGLAMVELKHDPLDDRWTLIEINARPWGSLPLALAAGVDFPAALVRMLLEDEVDAQGGYRRGLCARNLWMDFGWFLRNLRVDKRDPTLASRTWSQLGGELLNPLLLRERSDTLVADDPWPGVVEALRTAREAARLVGGRLARGVRESSLARRRAARRLRRELAAARDVLFVCKGNLVRSPLAERLARQRLPASVRVASAGYWRETGRASPREAIESARALGVDLADHRSSGADEARLRQADLVLVFDRENVRALGELHPFARPKIRLLGALLEQGTTTIKDPYGGTLSDYDAAYRRIARCLEPAPALEAALPPSLVPSSR